MENGCLAVVDHNGEPRKDAPVVVHTRLDYVLHMELFAASRSGGVFVLKMRMTALVRTRFVSNSSGPACTRHAGGGAHYGGVAHARPMSASSVEASAGGGASVRAENLGVEDTVLVRFRGKELEGR